MDYLVLDSGYNFGKAANPLFATNNRAEAIEAAREFGQGTVVVNFDSEGNHQRIFTAAYQADLALID